MQFINFVSAMTVAMLSLAPMAASWTGDGDQSHLNATNPYQPVKGRNISIGISFQPSHVAGTVLFEYDDGRVEWDTEIDRSSDEYREVMAKLSLPSSRHLAPPYSNDGEAWDDLPRQAYRRARKSVGLPASYDVGVLGHVVERIRTKLEETHDIHIDTAVFTASHLTALYQDDLEDVAAFLGINYLVPRWHFSPLVWEAASAYAGYGLGLCEHWQDAARCKKEMKEMDSIPVLSVHYTRNALTVSWPYIFAAIMAWEPEGRHFENFTLGSDVIKDYPTDSAYWDEVRAFLPTIIQVHPGAEAPRRIIVQGERVDEQFLHVLREVVTGQWVGEEVGPIYSHLAESASSRGAAEFMRRGPAPWRRTNEKKEVEL